MIKVIFLGTSDFAVPALKALVKNCFNITAVITQPDKPVGRNKIPASSPVKILAQENNIPVFQPHSLKKDDETFKTFKSLNPDLCVIAAYGKIIPPRYLNIPKHGFINIHPSLLPKYRGPSPIQSAILNGDSETGVTIMLMDEEVDHGPILKVTNCKLQTTSHYEEVEKELAEIGARLLVEVLPKYLDGSIIPHEQQHNQATYTKLLVREDGRIDWKQSAEKIRNQILALNPEPGTWTTWNGKVLNCFESTFFDLRCRTDIEPGTINRVDNQIAVATDKCYLILKTVQLEGGKKMDIHSFINGHPDFLNSKLV